MGYARNLPADVAPTPPDRIERSIPDNLQQPRPGILATEACERAEGPDERVLHHVLGGGRVLHQPARQAVSRPEIWNDVTLERRVRAALRTLEAGHKTEPA